MQNTLFLKAKYFSFLSVRGRTFLFYLSFLRRTTSKLFVGYGEKKFKKGLTFNIVYGIIMVELINKNLLNRKEKKL